MPIATPKLPRIVKSSNVDPVPYVGDNLALSEVCYEITTSFINGLAMAVTVIDRDGFEVTIPNVTGHLKKTSDFCVYVTFSFRQNVIIDASHLLDDVTDQSPKPLQALKKALAGSTKKLYSNMDRVQIVYKVTKEMMVENGGALYLDDLDITLCAGRNDMGIVHPESEVGRQLRFAMDDKNSGFSYRIQIVDPENQYGSRYINIAGEVYKIKPMDADNRKPGVYVYISSPKESSKTNGWHYYTFDIADKELSLFITASDASVFGDVAAERKAELEQLEADRKRDEINLRREVDAEKNRYEQMSIELKQKMDKLDEKQKRKQADLKQREADLSHQIKQLESELDKAKHLRDSRYQELKYELDTRSAIRKDTSDSMKYVWPVLIGAGAFIIPKLII